MPPDSGQIPRSDADLIGCSRTEPEEFTELFRRHAPDIQRYVTRRLGSGVLSGSGADDIVAETFLLAFRQRDRYDPSRADARAWLYGICTNLIGRHRRAEIRQYRAFARTGADPVTEPFTDRVDDRVSAANASPLLGAALAGMSARLRDTLLLAAWSDLSYEEIAVALGGNPVLPARTPAPETSPVAPAASASPDEHATAPSEGPG